MKPPFSAATIAAVIAAVSLAAGTGHAAPLGLGSTVPALGLKDQSDAPVALTSTTRRIVFAADKAAADLASATLAAQTKGVLQRQHAVYIADVSGMPGLVFRMFALPRLRELPFPVALVHDAATTADLPRQPGRVTVLELDGGTVTQLTHAADAGALLRALGVEPR